MDEQQGKAKHTFLSLDSLSRIPLKATFCFFLCEKAGAEKDLGYSSCKPNSCLRRLCTASYSAVTSCSPDIPVLLMFLCSPLRLHTLI